MKVTKFQHACLVIETKSATLIIDPGSYTHDFIMPRRVDAIIMTHDHPDHCDEQLVRRILKKFPKARIIGPNQVVSRFTNHQTTIASPDTPLEIADSAVRFFGGVHASISTGIQTPENFGVLIDDSLYYPGDSFTLPAVPVAALALPASAPWLRIDDAIQFLTAVRPQFVFPTHDAILSHEGKALVDRLLGAAAHTIQATYLRIDGEQARF